MAVIESKIYFRFRFADGTRLGWKMEGIRVEGVNVNNLRYADDTALLADEEKKLQDLLDVVVTESERKDLK